MSNVDLNSGNLRDSLSRAYGNGNSGQDWRLDVNKYGGATEAHHIIPRASLNKDVGQFLKRIGELTAGSDDPFTFRGNGAENGIALPKSSADTDLYEASGRTAVRHTGPHFDYTRMVDEAFDAIRSDMDAEIASISLNDPNRDQKIAAIAQRAGNRVYETIDGIRSGLANNDPDAVRFYLNKNDPLLQARVEGFDNLTDDQKKALMVEYYTDGKDLPGTGRISQKIGDDGKIKILFDADISSQIRGIVNDGANNKVEKANAALFLASVSKLLADYLGREDLSLEELAQILGDSFDDITAEDFLNVAEGLVVEAALEFALSSLRGPAAWVYTGYQVYRSYNDLRSTLVLAEEAFGLQSSLGEVNRALDSVEHAFESVWSEDPNAQAAENVSVVMVDLGRTDAPDYSHTEARSASVRLTVEDSEIGFTPAPLYQNFDVTEGVSINVPHIQQYYDIDDDNNISLNPNVELLESTFGEGLGVGELSSYSTSINYDLDGNQIFSERVVVVKEEYGIEYRTVVERTYKATGVATNPDGSKSIIFGESTGEIKSYEGANLVSQSKLRIDDQGNGNQVTANSSNGTVSVAFRDSDGILNFSASANEEGGINSQVSRTTENGEESLLDTNGVISDGDLIRSAVRESDITLADVFSDFTIEDAFPELARELEEDQFLVFKPGTLGRSAAIYDQDGYIHAESTTVNGVARLDIYPVKQLPDASGRVDPEIVIRKDNGRTNVLAKRGPDQELQPVGFYGQAFGSGIGQLLGLSGKAWEAPLYSTILGTIGNSYEQAIVATTDEFSHSEAREKAFDDFGRDLKDAAISAGKGFLSSMLMADVMDGLGLEDDPKTAAALQAVLGPVSGAFVGASVDFILSGFDVATFESSAGTSLEAIDWGQIFATYAGKRLADDMYSTRTREGAILSSVGASVGAYLGAALVAGPAGIAAAVAIAAVGALIGGGLGDLFGMPPKSGAELIYDVESQEFYIGDVYARGGAEKSTARSFANSAKDILNNILSVVGGEIINAEDIFAGSWGIYKDKLSLSINGRKKFSNANEMFEYGVLRVIPEFQIAGGNVFTKRMFYRAIEELLGNDAVEDFANLSGKQINEKYGDVLKEQAKAGSFMSLLSGRAQIATDYASYYENRDVIDALIALSPDSAFSGTWQVSFQNAKDFNLLSRHISDSIGGWRYKFDQSLATVADSDIGSGSLTVPAYYSSAVFDFVYNERYIYARKANGYTDTLRDEVTGANKGTINFTTQAALDSVVSEGERAAYIIKGTDSADTIRGGDLGNDIFGGGGQDTLYGGKLNDWIEGGAERDILHAGGGNNNVLIGGTGNDDLHGAEGSDWLIGGDDQDEIWGSGGDDIIEGGAGNGDELHGGYGNDVYIFRRGSGEDIIYDTNTMREQRAAYEAELAAYNEAVANGEYIDRPLARFSAESNMIEFEQGITLDVVRISYDSATDDLLIVLLNPDTNEDTLDKIVIKNWILDEPIEYLRFTDGLTINISGIENFISGTQGDDQSLNGTEGRDFIHGLSGNDIINALGGNDVAIGGRDDDTVKGDEGDDYLLGGHGVDKIYGGSGNDTMLGGIDNDELHGEAGNDILNGGAGDDKIVLGSGDDLVVFGRGDGKDSLYDLSESGGNSGLDTLEFRAGIDIMDVRIGRPAGSSDLLFGIEPTNSDDSGISDLSDSIALKAWFAADNSAIEHVRFYGQSSADAIDITMVGEWIGSDSGDNTVEASDLSDGFDWVTTGGGNDIIRGVRGGDIVNAGAGQDTVEVKSLGNRIFAGKGDEADTLSYSEKSSGVYANLNTREFVDRIALDNGYLDLTQAELDVEGITIDRDIAVGFENLTGTSHDDVIVGDDGENTLYGKEGNDYLVGGMGDDTYVFGPNSGNLTISEFDDDLGVYFPEPGTPENTEEAGGLDTLLFRGIEQDDLIFSIINSNDLLINIIGTSSSIVIENWQLARSTSVEFLSFDDNSELDIRLMAFDNTRFGETYFAYQNWLVGDDSSDDHILGYGNDDIINGLGGDDILDGGDGNDTFFGGLGADTFIGGSGSEDSVSYFHSDSGVTVALDNSEVSRGGEAAGDVFDSIEGVIGSLYRDQISGDAYSNVINGHNGNDSIHGRGGADTLQGGEGDDTLFGEDGGDTLTGNQGNDELSGGSGYDYLSGGEGNDILKGGGQDDYLTGDTGNDELEGNSGDDLLLGGTGNDTLKGGTGDDDLRGGDGIDTLEGGAHDDKLFGEAGKDTLAGDDGNDYLSGGDEDDSIADGGDTLNGGTGADVLEGGAGQDTLNGDEGSDTLVGGTGDDKLFGGSGKDVLIGGEGNDLLEGGTDSDVYIFAGEFGQDTVSEGLDRDATDELVFSGYTLNDLWFERSGNDLIISVIGTDNSVFIKNYNRFNVNSDAVSAALDQLRGLFESLTPVESLTVDTQQLDTLALESVINAMEAYEKPTEVLSVPQDVVDSINTYSEKTSLQESIQYAPRLISEVFSLEEDAEDGRSGTFRVEDYNPNETFVFSIIEDSPIGSLELNSTTGEFTYWPAPDFSGSDTFTIEVTDSTGLTSQASMRFRVNPVNDSGEFPESVYIDVAEDSVVESNFGFSDSDNILSDYILLNENVSTLGLFERASDGSNRIIFKAAQNKYGTETVVLQFTDPEDPNGEVYETTAHLTVTPINDAPVATAYIEYLDIQEDDSSTKVGEITVTDPDLQDTFTYEIDGLNGGEITLIEKEILDELGNPVIGSDGIVTRNPRQLEVWYKPNNNYYGEENVAITFTDSSGDDSSKSVTNLRIRVNSVNDAPELSEEQSDTMVSTQEDTSFEGTVVVEDVETENLIYTPNFDYMPAHGTLSVEPDGRYKYTPDKDWWGQDYFVVTADDGSGEDNSTLDVLVTVSVESVNDVPEFTAGTYHINLRENTIAGDLVVLESGADNSPAAQDFDSVGNVVYSLVDNADTDLNELDYFEISNGVLRAKEMFDLESDTLPSVFSFGIEALDSDGGKANAIINVNITNDPEAPDNIYSFELPVFDDKTIVGNPSSGGTVITQFFATDPDFNEEIKFSLSDSGEYVSHPGFAITEDGKLYLSQEFDFTNSTADPVVYVVATDKYGLSLLQSKTVQSDLIDHAPTSVMWINPESNLADADYSPTIDETITDGTIVGTLKIDDSDEINALRDWRVSLYRTDNNGIAQNVDELRLGNIDRAAGTVDVIANAATEGSDVFDAPVNGLDFKFGVRVSDVDRVANEHDIDQEISIVVDNVNRAPELSGPGLFYVNEFSNRSPDLGGSSNGAVNGTVIGTFSGSNSLFSDLDGDEIVYELVSGYQVVTNNFGNISTTDIFDIRKNTSTGLYELVVAGDAADSYIQNYNAKWLNYEAQTYFDLEVSGFDGTSFASNNASVRVNLNDINEIVSVKVTEVISGGYMRSAIFESDDDSVVLVEDRNDDYSEVVDYWGDYILGLSFIREGYRPQIYINDLKIWEGGTYNVTSPPYYGGGKRRSYTNRGVTDEYYYVGGADESGAAAWPFGATGYVSEIEIDFNDHVFRWGSYSILPVYLDLTGNGLVEDFYTSRFDYDGDGALEVGLFSSDAILALDRDYDGVISNGSEISFVDDLVGAETDLEGLVAYDSNSNGLLDAGDIRFDEFLVWQDLNRNGNSEPGELQGLSELGISSLTLYPLVPNEEPTGVDAIELINTSIFTRTNGTTGMVGDVKLHFEDYEFNNPFHHLLVEGTSNDDQMNGQLTADRINALGGNDQVFSGESHDIVNLGSGDDLAFLGDGDDSGYGEDGADTMYGDAGDDFIDGGAGQDSLYGGDGDDYIDGGIDADYMKGGAGTDTLVGGEGDDTIYGGDGNDVIFGGSGNDSISGGAGVTQLYFMAGDGDDFISADSSTYELNLAGITPEDIHIEQRSNGMLFSFDSAGSIFFEVEDALTLTQVRFDDGTEWDSQLISNEIERQLLGGITGSALADTVQGTAGNDSIEAYAGNDIVNANAGDDEVYGGAGSDELYGEMGNDILDGGDGDDIIDGGEGNDRLYGHNGNDTLSGQAGNDIIYAGYGNDFAYGGDGDDSVTGGEGDDYLNGGAGEDVLNGSGGKDTLEGSAGVDELYGGEGDDNLDGGEDDDYLQGDEGNDTLNGNLGNDIINAGSGDDTLIGAAGDDVLVADEGDDTLMGGDGTDSLFGDRGNDFLSGGEGTDNLFGGDGNDLYLVDNEEDIVEERENEGIDTVQSSVNWTLSDHVENVMLLADALEATGNELDNRLTGNDQSNILDGAAGADTMIGGLGDDTYIVDDVEDVTTELEGEGNDSVLASVDFSLADFIENLELTGTALSAVGNSLDNTLKGNAQSNTLEGLDGDDTLIGGLGDDYLDGGYGNDRIVFNYGDGHDFVKKAVGTYAVTLVGISANAFSFDVSESGVLKLDFAEGGSIALEGFDVQDSEDTLPLSEIRFENGESVEVLTRDEISYQLESAIASHVGDADNDYICGTSSADRIHAMAGNDYVLGYSGDDTLLGGSGDDSLYGGADNDTLLGGDGSDYLKGGSGNDVHDGGAGNDELEGSYGDDVYRFSIGDGHDTIYDISGLSTIQFGEGVSPESLKLIKDGYHLILEYGRSDSVLIKYAYEYELGEPVISEDFVVEFSDGTALTMRELRADKVVYSYGDAGIDTLVGDVAADHIDGSSGADNLYGNSGDDVLIGGDGYDDLYGEAGNDTLTGGAGNDDIFGGDGDDTLHGDEGHDDLYAGDGNDVVYGGDGDDTLDGNAGHDSLMGDSGDDNIDGHSGNDILFGGAGNDDLEGGDGDDTLSGGFGHDILDGGDGNDTYLFERGGDSTLIKNHSYDSGFDVVEVGDDISVNELFFERDWYDLKVTALDGGEVLEVDNWFVSDRYEVDAISVGGYELNADTVQMLVQAHSGLSSTASASDRSSVAAQNENNINNWMAVG